MTNEFNKGDVVFAAGNYYKVENGVEFNEFHKMWYVRGFRYIKSRKAFSKANGVNLVGPGKPVKVENWEG